MDAKQIRLILIAITVGCLGGGILLYQLFVKNMDMGSISDGMTTTEASGENLETEDSILPDFTVYDRDGNAVKLSDFAGKPIVLNFWASSYGTCKAEMPFFDDAYNDYKDKVQFIMVNVTDGEQETLESATQYIDSTVYRFPVYYDLDLEASTVFGVTSLPTTYFFDATGTPVAYAKTTMDVKKIKQGIELILQN